MVGNYVMHIWDLVDYLFSKHYKMWEKRIIETRTSNSKYIFLSYGNRYSDAMSQANLIFISNVSINFQ